MSNSVYCNIVLRNHIHLNLGKTANLMPFSCISIMGLCLAYWNHVMHRCRRMISCNTLACKFFEIFFVHNAAAPLFQTWMWEPHHHYSIELESTNLQSEGILYMIAYCNGAIAMSECTPASTLSRSHHVTATQIMSFGIIFHYLVRWSSGKLWDPIHHKICFY
jgi:hypothetical protein